MARADGGAGPARAEAGFTLIEVLAAFTILAVVLGVAYRILGDGALGIRAAERKADALAIAEAQLLALGTERVLEPGRFDGAGQGFTWTLSIEPRLDPPFDRAPERGMRAWRVDVEVRDDGGQVLTLSTTRIAAAGVAPSGGGRP